MSNVIVYKIGTTFKEMWKIKYNLTIQAYKFG
jgi:hypothetical protein